MESHSVVSFKTTFIDRESIIVWWSTGVKRVVRNTFHNRKSHDTGQSSHEEAIFVSCHDDYLCFACEYRSRITPPPFRSLERRRIPSHVCSRITAQKLGPCMCDTISHPGNPRSRYHLLSNRFVYELPAAERFFMVVPAGAGDSVQQEIDRLWGSTCHSPQRAGRRTIASSPGRHPTPTISDLKSAIPEHSKIPSC